MKRKKFLLFQMLVCILALFSCTSRVISVKPQPDFIQAKLDSIYLKEKIPGILVGVRNGGRNEYYTTGYAQPENKKKFDHNTFFEAGSITKTFTAFVLQSVLRDHQLSDTISILPFLPDSVQRNKAIEQITFLSLMNHTSGLPRLAENMILKDGDMQPYQSYDSRLLFEYLREVKPSGNKKSVYSNLGMALAGVLAERISGSPYATLLDKYIFLPFKIVNPENSLSQSGNKSQGYFTDTEKTPYWNMDVMAPAGGLKCSAKEMLSYLSYMSKPIDKKAAAIIDILLQPTAALSDNLKVCRAWHTFQQKEKPIIYWHNGGTYGFSTFAAFIKDTDQAVVVVVNMFNTNMITDVLGFKIMKKMLE